MNVWSYSIRKYKKRLASISLNAISQLVFPAMSILISWGVFHFSSANLWGEFFKFLLFASVAPLIIGWGNENYLLRSFSKKPSSAVVEWQSSLSNRLFLILPMAIFILLYPWNIVQKLLMIAFCISRIIYQSYDVIILYKRQFAIRICLETLGYTGIFIYIFIHGSSLNITGLLFIYTMIELAKAMFVVPFFIGEFPLPRKFGNFQYLVTAFPFFILGFTGFLQSKVDLLCINYYMPPLVIAHFQVLVNMLLYIQAGSAFILQPFVKNIYRMDERQVRLISRRLFLAGIPIVSAGVIFTYFVISGFYHFYPALFTLFLGGMAMLPIFYYLPLIYGLYGSNKQNLILGLNIAGAIISVILNILLIPSTSDGQNGALLATGIVQWLLAAAYSIIYRYKPATLKIRNAAN